MVKVLMIAVGGGFGTLLRYLLAGWGQTLSDGSFPLGTLIVNLAGCLLRIFIGESDKWKKLPLYEAIVMKARELHLAGATVLRGPMGFGAKSRLHTAKILRLSEDLPIIIEIVDSRTRIEDLMPHIDEMVQDGLVTLERVEVIKYRANEPEI